MLVKMFCESASATVFSNYLYARLFLHLLNAKSGYLICFTFDLRSCARNITLRGGSSNQR